LHHPDSDKRMAGSHPHVIRTALRNPIYIGQVVWNRQKFIRTPEGKRVAQPRPESEWVRVERPELRIIDDDLWQRVQRQVQSKRERYGRGGGGLYHSSGSTGHLLSGLLKCSECGGNLIIHSGYRNRQGNKTCYLACANHAIRHSCSNNLRESEAVLEERLLAGLEQHVPRAEIIDFAVTEF
jgi:site-specific DNA recombinase